MHVVELAFQPDEPRRLEARPAHREVLVRLHAEGRLVAAGPWDGDSGALLVFNASREELDQIMAGDPYYRAPGVTVVSVRRWQPIVGNFAA